MFILRHLVMLRIAPGTLDSVETGELPEVLRDHSS
jgi:hypothetical protein